LSNKNRKSLTPAEELRLQKLETKKYWLEKVKAQEKAESKTKKEVKSLPASDKNRKSLLKQWTLTPSEELRLHILKTKKYWLEKVKAQEKAESKTKKEVKLLPLEWKMLNEITLRPWQEEAIPTWFKDKRGTIKVFAAAGKTILALAIIEELQRTEKDLRVAIIVPTIVLLKQWYVEIKERSNLPEEAIGLLGAGHEDSFTGDQKKILICVLNSAARKLPKAVEGKLGNKLLLVVDECHRAGASEMRKIFKVTRKYELGLSATPEREDDEEEDKDIVFNGDYNGSLLGREIGPLVYEMTLKEAYDRGFLPGFDLRHYALPLTAKERYKYDSLSHSIQELYSELELKDRGRSKNFFSGCQVLAKQGGELGNLAQSFIWKTGERKRLLYHAKARSDAVVKILKDELKNNPDIRAILFHESIEEVMDLYRRLLKEGIPVVADNSKLSENLRETSIDLFRRGIAKVIVSARTLIEGFNVPSADIGIIVASNASVRQRIQTIGRVLRKLKIGEKEKKSVVYVLYMDKTTDEYIYEKTDWNEIIGAE
jgi:superfamily II DNA or RNA helicase